MTKYKAAVAWIAHNDSNGESTRHMEGPVSELVTTALVADVFKKDTLTVAKDIIKLRLKAEGKSTRKLKCQRCGSTDDTVHRCFEPYQADINGVNEEVIYCSTCYGNSCDDI